MAFLPYLLVFIPLFVSIYTAYDTFKRYRNRPPTSLIVFDVVAIILFAGLAYVVWVLPSNPLIH